MPDISTFRVLITNVTFTTSEIVNHVIQVNSAINQRSRELVEENERILSEIGEHSDVGSTLPHYGISERSSISTSLDLSLDPNGSITGGSQSPTNSSNFVNHVLKDNDFIQESEEASKTIVSEDESQCTDSDLDCDILFDMISLKRHRQPEINENENFIEMLNERFRVWFSCDGVKIFKGLIKLFAALFLTVVYVWFFIWLFEK